MDLTAALIILGANGIDLLRAINAAINASSVEHIAHRSGFPTDRIKHYQWIWSFYKEPEVQAAAQKAQLSFGVVEILAKAANKGNKERNKTADMLVLCELVAGLDPDTARAVAFEQVRNWKKADDSDKADFAHMHKEVEEDGKRRLVVRLRDDRASEIHRVLHYEAKALMKASDGAKPYPVAYADALCQKILGTSPAADPLFAPMFIIPTDCQYFADGRIATTAGALVDLADLVNEPLKDTGYAAIMAKDEHGVPAVAQLVPVQHESRDERFAPPEIRLIATMETLKCSRPGCVRAAANCEMHHIDAWSLGGKTTTANIAALCSTHNGLNDDNPANPPKHGRIERDSTTGRPGLRREPDAPLEFNRHPLVKKGTRTLGEQFYHLDVR